MSDPTPPVPPPVPPPAPSASRPRKTRLAVWGALAVLAGLTVLTVSAIVISQVTAALATQTSSPSPTPDKPGPPDRPGHRGGLGNGFPGMGLRGPLHGEFTVEKADGGYEVVVVQTGTVTGKSADTLTVKSEDGYTATYTVNNDTSIIKDGDQANLADLATNETVHVVGSKSGGTLTARFVHEGDMVKRFHRDGGGPGGWRHEPEASPSPSPTRT
jgi:hypothetical protein